MCANFKPITLQQLKALGLPLIPFEYVDEVFPNFQMPLLFKSGQAYEWRAVNFGLIPKWAEDTALAKYTYNARNETLLSKPSFQDAFMKCNFGVIPVTEFYEIKYINAKPQRWGIRRKDGRAFYIAALYEIVKIEQQIVRSATLITMEASDHSIMKKFHKPEDQKRSIIIVSHERLDEWLSLSTPIIDDFVIGFPVEEFESFYCPKTRLPKNSPQLHIFD